VRVNATVTHIAPVDSTRAAASDDSVSPTTSTHPSPALRIAFTHVLPLLVGCLLGQLLPTLAQMPGFRLHVLWIPGPLLMGWLLFTPRPQWRTCLLAAAAGTVLASVLVPFVGLSGLVASAGELVLVAAAAWLLLRWRGTGSPLEGYRDIALFVVLGGIALPVCVAWWQMLVVPDAPRGLAAPGVLRTRLLCSSVSYLLIVPAVVNIARVLQTPERRAGWRWRTVAIAVALLGALGGLVVELLLLTLRGFLAGLVVLILAVHGRHRADCGDTDLDCYGVAHGGLVTRTKGVLAKP